MKKKVFDKSLLKNKIYGNILKSSFFGLSAGLFLALATAFLYYKTELSFDKLNIFAIFIYIVSALTSGFFAGKMQREKGMALGIFTGLVIFTFSLLVSLFLNFSFGITLLYKLAISILSGAIGGILGVNSKQKRKIKPKNKA